MDKEGLVNDNKENRGDAFDQLSSLQRPTKPNKHLIKGKIELPQNGGIGRQQSPAVYKGIQHKATNSLSITTSKLHKMANSTDPTTKPHLSNKPLHDRNLIPLKGSTVNKFGTNSTLIKSVTKQPSDRGTSNGGLNKSVHNSVNNTKNYSYHSKSSNFVSNNLMNKCDSNHLSSTSAASNNVTSGSNHLPSKSAASNNVTSGSNHLPSKSAASNNVMSASNHLASMSASNNVTSKVVLNSSVTKSASKPVLGKVVSNPQSKRLDSSNSSMNNQQRSLSNTKSFNSSLPLTNNNNIKRGMSPARQSNITAKISNSPQRGSCNKQSNNLAKKLPTMPTFTNLNNTNKIKPKLFTKSINKSLNINVQTNNKVSVIKKTTLSQTKPDAAVSSCSTNVNSLTNTLKTSNSEQVSTKVVESCDSLLIKQSKDEASENHSVIVTSLDVLTFSSDQSSELSSSTLENVSIPTGTKTCNSDASSNVTSEPIDTNREKPITCDIIKVSGPGNTSDINACQNDSKGQDVNNPLVTSDKNAPGSLEISVNLKNGGSLNKRMWSMEDFEIGNTLGKGKFGIVFLAREKKSKTVLALKVIHKQIIEKCNALEQIQREIEIHSHLRHPNILKLFGYFYDEKRVYMILEVSRSGDLYNHLNAQPNRSFNLPTTVSYISQVGSALEYCHARKVIHRDIKLENILIGMNGSLKVADFGWSVHTPNDRRTTLCGTLDYLAPEIIANQDYDDKVDCWALGVLTYELRAGKPSFEATTQKETFRRIANVDLRFPFHFTDETIEFIRKLLVNDPKNRMSMKEVVNHPWILENGLKD